MHLRLVAAPGVEIPAAACDGGKNMVKKTPSDWLTRYYPKPADEVGVRAAVQHSLRKWRGLRVIGQYGIHQQNTQLRDANKNVVLEVITDSCALCQHYFTPDNGCAMCPLSIIRGRVPCDVALVDEDRSPWEQWVKEGDPEPMIRWLEKAKAQESVLSTGKARQQQG